MSAQGLTTFFCLELNYAKKMYKEIMQPWALIKATKVLCKTRQIIDKT